MKRILDISASIGPSLPVYPGNPPPRLIPVRRIATGDAANVSELQLGTHTGTHVDPPSHFIQGGATAESLDLETLVGPAVVADLTHVSDHIGIKDIESLDLPDDLSRLLLKTRNSELWHRDSATFPENYIGVTPEASSLLIARGVRLLGVDFLSVEPFDSPGRPTHHLLLGAGIIVVEGLDLYHVQPGLYTLYCLPLKLVGADGSPARAILVSE